jgi:hypothetical protein
VVEYILFVKGASVNSALGRREAATHSLRAVHFCLDVGISNAELKVSFKEGMLPREDYFSPDIASTLI